MAHTKSLPTRAEVTGRKLVRRVLATAKQLVDEGLSEDQVKRGLTDLMERSFIRKVTFGCLLTSSDHYFLTSEGLDYLGASDEERSWHSLDAVGSLLIYNIVQVEAVNDLSTLDVADGWKLEGIQWYVGSELAMDAVAAYRHPDYDSPAYRVFLVLSPMDNQWELCARLEQLRESLQEQALAPAQTFYPADVCIVAADEWGAARSLVMADAVLSGGMLFGGISSSQLKAWYYSNEWRVSDGRRVFDGWRVSDGLSAITGSKPYDLASFAEIIDVCTNPLRPVANDRSLGGQYFDRIPDRKASIWARGTGKALFHVLRILCDQPVISVAHLTALAGEARRGRETRRRLEMLVELGLAEMEVSQAPRVSARLRISRRGHGGPRFSSSAAGRNLLWLTWRYRPSRLHTRSGQSLLQRQRWSFPHQDLVYEILSQCREGGWPVAPGWRAHAKLANGRVIEPDGVVWVRTPWGIRWCFLEVELSDTSEMSFKDRCEKYGSTDRLENHPLMMVLRNELAEVNFHKAVARFAPGLQVMTTILPRLRQDGVRGSGVWRIRRV